MIESRDAKTRIWRHEFGTVSPIKARECLEAVSYVKKKYEGNNVVRYIGDVEGVPFEITATPTRVIFFSPNKYALLQFEKLMQPEEWEYDNSNRNDYMTKK